MILNLNLVGSWTEFSGICSALSGHINQVYFALFLWCEGSLDGKFGY